MRVLCDDNHCFYWHPLEEPKHLTGSRPQDWDKGYSGFCTRSEIGIKVRTIQTLDMKHSLPECRCRATRNEWRIRLPDPEKIQGGRILGSQEH